MKKFTLLLILLITFTSCGVQWQYSSLNTAGQIDSIYRTTNTQIDTISSVYDLRRKLRNDFNFRYDFAQYAMNQPYSFYWNNPRLEDIWRPYNRFDVYFYSNWFWNDWAFNYPFHHTWGWNSWHNWNRPYNFYGWNRPYSPWNNWYQGPFNNSGYNVVWNSSRRGRNIAYINGPRGSMSQSDRQGIASMIETSKRNNSRVNVNKPLIIPNINNNSKPRINNNNNTIRINKPRINNNTRPRINNNTRPRINNNYNSRPSINSSRSPNTVRSSNSKPNNTIKQRQ